MSRGELDLEAKQLSILLVDDERTSRLVLKRLLEGLFHEIMVVSSAEEAYEALENDEESKIGIILTDLHMPGQSGIDLTRRIRGMESGRASAIPIVLMSASDELSMVYEGLNAGCDSFLLKPINRSQLLNLLENVRRKRREQRIIAALDQERNWRSTLEENVANLHRGLGGLRSSLRQSVDLPIHRATALLQELASPGSDLSPEHRTLVQTIITELRVPEPGELDVVFDRMLGEIDPVSQNYLNDLLGMAPPRVGSRHSSSELPICRSGEEVPALFPGSPLLGPSSSSSSEALLGTLLELTPEQEALAASLEFNPWMLSEEELVAVAVFFFRKLGLVRAFSLNLLKLQGFVSELRLWYKAVNPYHSFRHACDVAQMAFLLLTEYGGNALLRPLEQLAFLVAAIGHDVDHPGVSNAFLIRTRSPLAMRYNDRSVLENHHCATLFHILAQSETNCLAPLSESQWREARTLIVEAVLNTDLSLHLDVLNRFKVVTSEFSAESAEHRKALLCVLLKSADISNLVRPPKIAMYWSSLVRAELLLQGDREAALGLPCSPFADRRKSGEYDHQMTQNFAAYVVGPLFQSLVDVLPKFEDLIQRLEIMLESIRKLNDSNSSEEEKEKELELA